MPNFENLGNNIRAEATAAFSEKESLKAISEGRALPTPEFLAESEEAKAALLHAFDEATNINEGLAQLEPEQREKFVQVIADVLDKEEKPSSSDFKNGLIKAGAAALAIGAAETSEMGDLMGDTFGAFGAVAAGLAAYDFFKAYKSTYTDSSVASDLIKNHLKKIATN